MEAGGPVDQLEDRVVHHWRLVTGDGATLGTGHVPALVGHPDPGVTGGLRDLPGALVTAYVFIVDTVQHIA